MNIDYEIALLNEQYKKELEELKELFVLFNPHCSSDMSFESAMERFKGNALNRNEEDLFFDILKANKTISDLDLKIRKLKAKRDYDIQVNICYLQFITKQVKDEHLDESDKEEKYFETYIPEEVETGYFESEEERIIIEQTTHCYETFLTHQESDKISDRIDNLVEKYQAYIPDDVETGMKKEETHGIKKVKLEYMPIVEENNLENGEYVSNSELGAFAVRVNNKINQNRVRRKKGINKAGNFRPGNI